MSLLIAFLVAVASAIGASRPAILPSTLPADPTELRAGVDLAQRVIDDPCSPSTAVASAGEFEQLTTIALAREPRATQHATLARLARPAAIALRTNLDAAAALARIVTPRKSAPPWRIVAPPAPDILLAYFQAAGSRFGLPWQFLAAIEFVETKFGRVHGLSTAGAEGPMQFLRATWARYGTGDVHNPRDAIFGAARFLVAAGARSDMAGALYSYNPSTDYVRAIADYAGQMRADPRAYYGYYWWQVTYARRGRVVVLPVGYPSVPPAALP